MTWISTFMTWILTFLLLLIGVGLVHLANLAYDCLPSCRYREYKKYAHKAETYTMLYTIVGLLGLLIFPSGMVAFLGIFGYATYRRYL